MGYKEIRKAVDDIIKAIKKGKYEVSYDEPNNIWECTAPDGRTFYKFVDMDGIKSSNDFGTCHVYVNGFSFSCDLGTGDYENDFFDSIEDEIDDDTNINEDELIEEIIDAIKDRDDIWFGEYSDMDWQMQIYAQINKIKNPEYYWCEDSDCPVDIEDRWIDYKKPSELGYGTIFFQRCKYFLVEEPNHEEGEKLHAVHCKETPDDDGSFSTVLLTLSYKKSGKIKVTDCEDTDEEYYAADGYIE